MSVLLTHAKMKVPALTRLLNMSASVNQGGLVLTVMRVSTMFYYDKDMPQI